MLTKMQKHQSIVDRTMRELEEKRIVDRIFAHDHTVWRDDPAEIADRLGWLDIAERMVPEAPALTDFAAKLRDEGFTHALLLGMGGSSLAPELFRKAFGVAPGGMDLSVLDSTDPGAVLGKARTLDPAHTLIIVSTKSGGTVETFSFFKYFYNWTEAALGKGRAGGHFIAITDPGSGLAATAEHYAFRRIFLNDPQIGGRYSALSLFGLVPAAMLGVDLDSLLTRAVQAGMDARRPGSDALFLGAAMGALAGQGLDKLSLICSPQLDSFGDWVEQLVAESTGKQGRGILPVVGEPAGNPPDYGPDRFFAGLELAGDTELQTRLDVLEAAGYPVIRLRIDDEHDLGAQFFLWEMATAIAGHVMGIQPFDQPNVESAKISARKMTTAYLETGALPAAEAAFPSAENLAQFLSGIKPGDYVAVQAYITPSAGAGAALRELRGAIRSMTGAAVTAGYGPRFLHSTGQLHKGDGGNGRFIQIVSESAEDAAIPEEAGSPDSRMSFQVLKLSQALGDFEALRKSDPPRRVIRFDVRGDPAAAIANLF